MTVDELEILADAFKSKTPIQVSVSGCAVSCCGRPWTRREGEQRYTGKVNHLTFPERSQPGHFVLFTAGIGTTGVIALIAFDEVEELDAW